jgi:multidrug resistance efflux pump
MSATLPRSEPTAAPAPPAPPPAPAPNHRRHPPRALVVLLLLLAIGAAAYRFWPTPIAGPLTVSGTIEADEVMVAAEAAGRLVDVAVDEGDPVRAGQVVARLDDSLMRIQLRQAGPAETQILEAQLDKLSLRAPLTGTVTKRLARRGEVVAAGAPVLAVARTDELKVTVYVPEAQLGRVRSGQAVALRVDAFPGRTFPAEVQSIATRAEFTPRNVQTARDRQALVFAVKLRVPNASGELKAGLPVDATFPE